MKTTIEISGQISGNFRLRSALATAECIIYPSMFNGFRLTYPTKKQAKKALWDGYKKLRQNEPEMGTGIGGIRYSKWGSLSYDASTASIQDA